MDLLFFFPGQLLLLELGAGSAMFSDSSLIQGSQPRIDEPSLRHTPLFWTPNKAAWKAGRGGWDVGCCWLRRPMARHVFARHIIHKGWYIIHKGLFLSAGRGGCAG